MADFDFSHEAFYDNHTHRLFMDRTSVTAEEFALNYYHGVRDAEDGAGNPCPSAAAFSHMPYQSVVQTLVHVMSHRFGCEESLQGVVAFRNSCTKTPEELRGYTRMLYADQKVCGCTLDCELPMGHRDTMCFPARQRALAKTASSTVRI